MTKIEGFTRADLEEMLSVEADEPATVNGGLGPEESHSGRIARLIRTLLATATKGGLGLDGI